MSEEEKGLPKSKSGNILKGHKGHTWLPDSLGHRQANKIGRRTGKNEQQELEDRTEAIKRELGLVPETPKEDE